MSVKDRIRAMNRLCSAPAGDTIAPVEKKTFRTRSNENSSVRDRIRSMNTKCSSLPVVAPETVSTEKRVLRSWNSETHSRGRGFGPVSQTRSIDGSRVKTPMKLPGLITEKGASKFEEQDPNETDIEEVIERLKANDPSLTEVNLNNHCGLDSDLIVDLLHALRDNEHLQILLMSNVRVDENHAQLLAEALLKNSSLRVLNVESNRITRKGIKAIMKALAENESSILKELRMVNQYFAGGAGAEGEIARYLDKIKTITKLGYNFTVPSFRTKVDGYIMRNLDYERKRRAAQSSCVTSA